MTTTSFMGLNDHIQMSEFKGTTYMTTQYSNNTLSNSIDKELRLNIDQSTTSTQLEFPLLAASVPNKTRAVELFLNAADVGTTKQTLYINRKGNEPNAQVAKKIQNTLDLNQVGDNVLLTISLLVRPTGSGGVELTSNANPNVPATTTLFSAAGLSLGINYMIVTASNITPGTEAVTFSLKKLKLDPGAP